MPGLNHRPRSAGARKHGRDVLAVDLGLQSATNGGKDVRASLGCKPARSGGIVGFSSALKGRVEEPAAGLSLCLDLASGWSIWKLTSVRLGLMGDFASP
jgi:hypothetical protein